MLVPFSHFRFKHVWFRRVCFRKVCFRKLLQEVPFHAGPFQLVKEVPIVFDRIALGVSWPRSLARSHAWAALLALPAIVGCSGGGPDGRPVGLKHRDTQDVRATSRVPVVVSEPRPFRVTQLAVHGHPGTSHRSAPGRLPSVPGTGRAAVTSPEARPGEWQTTAAQTVIPSLVAEPVDRDRDATAAAHIRAALRAYLTAFNRHDASGLASLWTAGGTSVDLASGEVTAGRDAVQGVFAALFAEDESASIDIDVESIRPLREGVAVVDGVTRLSFDGADPTQTRFSAVMVEEDGQWRLASMREASASQTTAPSSPAHPLAELGWLVGSWEDIGAGVTAGTACFWSAGRGFLVRTHTVTFDDTPEARPAPGDERIPGLLPAGPRRPLELTEIIGWDPRERAIRSWVFTSTGGFAEGTWSREASGWKVRLEGRGADSGLTCVCALVPQGADGLTVTCDTDALAHLLPPACDFVRTARAE